MASTSKPPTASATPAPSSPPPSESLFSELDGTAASVLDTSADLHWDVGASGHGLNLVSWKKGVDEGDDVSDKRGFYAISTVLNHPTKKANPLRSTRKPLPPLGPGPPLPKPPPATHFDAYLKAVTPLYDNLLRSRAVADASPADVLTGAFDTQSPAPADLPPLGSVPDLFFSKEFDLANPVIWDRVVEAGPSRSQPSASVHDHLSSHLDTLERHLIHEITLRSTSFFSALSNLQDLHSESASCLRRISDLQTGLKEVGDQQARKGLTILDKMEDLRVLRVTERGMGDMREVEEVIAVARGLVEGGDWAGALGCVGDVVRWWVRHRPNEEYEPPDPSEDDEDDAYPLPLAILPALLPLPLAVSDLTTQIALQLESALQSYLLSTLSSAELDVPYDKERFRDHVVPIVEGLVRCGAGDAVEGVWREVVTLAVREGSRKHLPVALAEEEGDEIGPQEMRGANLASALKSMDHSRYLLLAAQMYTSILARLRLAQTIATDLSSILTAASDLPPLRVSSFTPSAESDLDISPPIVLDTTDIIASACELGNLRASKILAVRGEQHAGLGINDFVELFKENWAFVLATEALAQRMIASLRSVTASQARTFLIVYHSQRLTKSAKLVEEEQWNQIDVTSEMQHTVNILIESAVSDPAESFIPPRQSANGRIDGALSKTLDVEETKFFVVRATAESIALLADYLGVVVNLEVVVTDVMGRIIEFLKSFNSRTCQVVLGARAMRSAGLKNITAKHLALASQSLSAIVALIPYIREFIRRHLSVKQAVMLTEFDKLKRDYQEHQNEIHAKLVAIMSDRLAVHVGSLRDIDWEATPEKDGPRAYAELLVKETATLHKVLGKYLALSTVEAVMSEVLAAITHRLSEEYGRIELRSDEGKNRLVQDAALITARLIPLSEAGKTVASLEVLVKDKPVPRKNIIGNLLKRGGRKGGVSAAGAGQGDGEMEEDEYDDGDDEELSADADAQGDGELIATEEERSAEPIEVVDEEKKSEETPRELNETDETTTATAGTSVPDATEAVPQASEAAAETSKEIAPSPPEKIVPATTATEASTVQTPLAGPELPLSIVTSPPPPSSTSRPTSPAPPPANPILSPPSSIFARLTSPPPPHADIRSPSGLPALPVSPSPIPASPSEVSPAPRSIRAPRVSLANRLKGVVTRAGSVDREEQLISPPPASGAGETRGSMEGSRRSGEAESVRSEPGKVEEPEEGVLSTPPPPPVPSKEEKEDHEEGKLISVTAEAAKLAVPDSNGEAASDLSAPELAVIPVEIISPIPRRLSSAKEIPIPSEAVQPGEMTGSDEKNVDFSVSAEAQDRVVIEASEAGMEVEADERSVENGQDDEAGGQ